MQKENHTENFYVFNFFNTYCIGVLHHHRLFAAVCECEHKPSVVVDGDALDGGAETTVLPFGAEKVKLAKLKEHTALAGGIEPLKLGEIPEIVGG